MSVARYSKRIKHNDFFIHRKIPIIIRRYLFDAVSEHCGNQIRVKNPIGSPRILMHKHNGDRERFFGWRNNRRDLGNGIHCFFRLKKRHGVRKFRVGKNPHSLENILMCDDQIALILAQKSLRLVVFGRRAIDRVDDEVGINQHGRSVQGSSRLWLNYPKVLPSHEYNKPNVAPFALRL